MQGEEEKKVAFGFFKQSKHSKLASKSAIIVKKDDSDHEEDNGVQLITGIEGDIIHSVNGSSKKRKPDFIVPLIDKNSWRDGNSKKRRVDANDTTSDSSSYVPNDDSIKSQAIKAILAGLREEQISPGSTLQVPLLMRNAPPPGFETDSLLDVSCRPDAPDDADYDTIPVESFGLAALRGMGFNGTVEDLKKEAEHKELKMRPKGLGLGAEGEKDKDKISNGNNNGVASNENGEELQWKKGVHCKVVSGKDTGKYGTIVTIDGDLGRVLVDLPVGKESKSFPQAILELVSKTEFSKLGKYMNTEKVNRYKSEQERSGWLRKGCRVKVCDEDHKHFKHKLVVIEEVDGGSACRCEDSTGRTVSGIFQTKQLETVVPRKGGSVLVVRGVFAGHKGTVSSDSSGDTVRVRLRSKDTDIKFDLDDVCEIVLSSSSHCRKD